MERYIPPKLNREKSNVENSQNTTLFLVSCFQYIFAGVVLSTGPPFRQTMTQNCTCIHNLADRVNDTIVPFVITIITTLLFSAYMLLDPGAGLARFMQLTYLSIDFKIFILVLALGGFLFAWIAERRVFLWLARMIGKAHDRMWPQRRKKKKKYKLLQAKMRI